MPFKKRIYGESHCPRCNAIAQLRAFDTETVMVELRLVCPKCRLSKYVKMTTQKSLDLEKKEKKLLDLLERANSPQRRNALLKQIEKTRREKLVTEVQP
jgi:ssDNA-binding Zn-finger/Zn-ribbon topoisomerase 1